MAAEGLSTVAPGKCQVIPPIPNVADRNLLCRIRAHIKTETGELGCPDQGPDEQRYIIYRNVFDKVIDNATAYKNILTTIKKEYEESINVLHKGREDSRFLHRKLKSMASEPMTLVAYKKRASQLQNKIDFIKQNTAGLEAHLQAVKNSRNVKGKPTEETLPPQDGVFHIKRIPEVDSLWPELFDDDDPSKINESTYLLEYVERFNELFDNKQYKAAAIHVANCPRGILNNLEVMERFKAVTEYEGNISPLLLFFEAVMSSFSTVRHSPNAKMSLEGVECALKQNRLDLIIHWVIQERLICSETLGEVIYNYGDTELRSMDTCMALAQIVYNKCGVHKKAALCMCRCGQISGAMAYIHESKKFSLDDYLFLLNKCPNTELILCLTHEWNGNPAVLSIRIAVLWLISNDHKEVGFHLLKEIYDSGQGAMEQAILNDIDCTLEDWQEIAYACNAHSYNAVADSIFAVLTSQEGGTVITITADDDNNDARLMEHIFL
ncbi:clathrin heavy chain linker domain-containing protein 1-like isoform X4 [Carcharodon carcharias]|uniref:clathrin heavy chain linker domain-containing protein 1-like isoform X4 n=1 Tax=Carcharodon carcharias TaxID=13397 RepID=UPI001B7EA627|nr:clathrin heavy chain linker domain-containing protein 1-like isoform X4 [Carcharodon carcharias]